MTEIKDFFDQLKEKSICILENEADLLIYAHGCYPVEYKWILQGKYKYLPEGIVIPEDTEQVQTILKLANKLGVKIIPFGGGSGIVGGSIPNNNQVILDIKRLSSISINPKNMTARAGAGVSGAELEDELNKRGFTCGHFPQSFQSAVLGGMVATRAIGTFSTKYGKMDDIVCGLSVVLPNGDIFNSHKAPARSSGPELNELFLGSEGVYGVITDVEVKIYPQAEKRHFECFTFPTTELGLEAIHQLMHKGLRPAVIRLYDEEESIPKIEKLGFEKGYAYLILGYEGLADFIDLEIKHVRKICLDNGGVYHGAKGGIDWFNMRFTTKGMLDYDARKGDTSDAIEVAAPWDCIENVWREMRKVLEPLCDKLDCHFSHFYHSGASVYVIFHAKSGGDDVAGEALYRKCLDLAIRTSLKWGGNVSHHHGIGTAKAGYLKDEHGETGMNIMKQIKDSLDPKGILNKGVLGL